VFIKASLAPLVETNNWCKQVYIYHSTSFESGLGGIMGFSGYSNEIEIWNEIQSCSSNNPVYPDSNGRKVKSDMYFPLSHKRDVCGS